MPETGSRSRRTTGNPTCETPPDITSAERPPIRPVHAVRQRCAGPWPAGPGREQLSRNDSIVDAALHHSVRVVRTSTAKHPRRQPPSRRSPWRLCASDALVARFHRPAQSARNAGPKLRIRGAGALPAAPMPVINARAARRASSTFSVSIAPRVRSRTPRPMRRCTIHVLRPVGRPAVRGPVGCCPTAPLRIPAAA